MTIAQSAGLTGKNRRTQYTARLQDFDRGLRAFCSINAAGGECDEPVSEGKLAQVPFGVKDNIAVAGLPLTCASNMLADFVSPYSATVVERLQASGAVVVGKCNMDEFGMGSSTEHSRIGRTYNPWVPERVAGGSSGGSAAAVAAGMVPFSLGSDTGGSVRQPAGFCGVYGLKPTYGYLSRFGLVAYASSLEAIGIIAGNAGDIRTVFNIAAGVDVHDQTTTAAHIDGNRENESTDKPTLGYIENVGHCDQEVIDIYRQSVERFRDLGYTCKKIELPLVEFISPAYYTIATAEASANLARYDAVRYGARAPGAADFQHMTNASRSSGFGSEVKLRIMLGSYVLRSGFQDRYYLRAQQIRRRLRREVAAVHHPQGGGGCDVLLLPTYPTLPFMASSDDAGEAAGNGGGLSSLQQKQGDRFTCLSNLTGAPALSIPADLSGGLPVGIQAVGRHGSEQQLFALAEAAAAGGIGSAVLDARPKNYLDTRDLGNE